MYQNNFLGNLIDIKQYKINNTLSRGPYGRVYEIEHIENGERYAAKVIVKKQLTVKYLS